MSAARATNPSRARAERTIRQRRRDQRAQLAGMGGGLMSSSAR